MNAREFLMLAYLLAKFIRNANLTHKQKNVASEIIEKCIGYSDFLESGDFRPNEQIPF